MMADGSKFNTVCTLKGITQITHAKQGEVSELAQKYRRETSVCGLSMKSLHSREIGKHTFQCL